MHMPQDLLHDKMQQEKLPTGRPWLTYKDPCMGNFKGLEFNLLDTWEEAASGRCTSVKTLGWRQTIQREVSPTLKTHSTNYLLLGFCNLGCHAFMGLQVNLGFDLSISLTSNLMVHLNSL